MGRRRGQAFRRVQKSRDGSYRYGRSYAWRCLAAEVDIAEAHRPDALFSFGLRYSDAVLRGDAIGARCTRLRDLLFLGARRRLCVSDSSGQRAGNQGNLQHIHFVLQYLRFRSVGSPRGGLRGQ